MISTPVKTRARERSKEKVEKQRFSTAPERMIASPCAHPLQCQTPGRPSVVFNRKKANESVVGKDAARFFHYAKITKPSRKNVLTGLYGHNAVANKNFLKTTSGQEIWGGYATPTHVISLRNISSPKSNNPSVWKV